MTKCSKTFGWGAWPLWVPPGYTYAAVARSATETLTQ